MSATLQSQKPDIKISVKQTFNIDTEMEVEGFSEKNQYVPEIDSDYKFDRDTTLAILSGFSFNKRVLVQGYHGTGKSTHIEQVAARLNWPCIRVNLDSHVSRIDLIGKDALVWNAHRVYGPERLPLLFRNFRITKWYGYSPKVLFNQPLDENGFQPVVTLRKVDESLFKDNIKVVL